MCITLNRSLCPYLSYLSDRGSSKAETVLYLGILRSWHSAWHIVGAVYVERRGGMDGRTSLLDGTSLFHEITNF